MPRDDLDELDLDDADEEEEDDLDDLDDMQDEDDEEDDEQDDGEIEVPLTGKANPIAEEDGWEAADADEEDLEEEDDDADDDEEDEEEEDADGEDEKALMEQPRHRVPATGQKKRSGSTAHGHRSAGSVAGKNTPPPRSHPRARAAKHETRPNPSRPALGLTPRNQSPKRNNSSRRK